MCVRMHVPASLSVLHARVQLYACSLSLVHTPELCMFVHYHTRTAACSHGRPVCVARVPAVYREEACTLMRTNTRALDRTLRITCAAQIMLVHEG